MKLFFYIAAIFSLFPSHVKGQFEIPSKPSNAKQVFVYDYAGILPDAQEQLLNEKLKRYADTTSTQIVYAIIDSANGEELDLLGARWGQKWGLGQEKEDNGILVILAVRDREVDINTGYGIESILSDFDAERIVNRILVPNFRNQNYYQGLDQGADAIFKRLQGEFSGEPSQNTGIPWIAIIFFGFFLLIVIMRARNNKDGNHPNSGNGSLLDIIILSSLGRGGFGGGSFGGGSSGGGFGGGFGGGGFGGGGAGGSW